MFWTPPKRRVEVPKLEVIGHVVIVTKNERTGETETFETPNIVTDAGDDYYAYRCANEQPPDNRFTTGAALAFDGIMELYNGASNAPAKGNDRSDLVGLVSGSAKAMDSGYPKRNDDDTDNTGAGADIVTYRVTYALGEANASGIDDVILTNPSPGASEALLMHADGLGRTKTSADTLKVFINHRLNGV